MRLKQLTKGQRYSTARMSKEATDASGGHDGVELLETKPYFDERTQSEGTYEHKVYHVGG